MNVICVQQLFSHPSNTYNPPMPEVGSEYVVIDEVRHGGFDLYVLAGFPSDCGYVKSGFATLPDSTADEMAEESREAIVNLETVLV
jgi:hypothetical protein